MTRAPARLAAAVCALAALPLVAGARSLQKEELRATLESLVGNFDGRAGICVRDESGQACVNADQRFSLQSVMKLLVALASLDAVDRGAWRLDDPVLVRRQDLSLFVQPLAKLVTGEGFRTTIGDLVRRAIMDSDSAATDILVAKLGGPRRVQEFLDRHAIPAVRFDRDERHLQTEIAGLEWRAEFVDPAALQRAIEGVPERRRDESYRSYQRDPRDTATPAGLAGLLFPLARGRLLSPPSTRFLLDAMRQTRTFPDRLRAGVPEGWTLANKTGTSGSWKGVTAATNDVGILTAPDGAHLAIVVMLGDSREPAERRSRLIAEAARLAAGDFR
jgi:beta-lactamase class A